MNISEIFDKDDVLLLPEGLSKWKAIQYMIENASFFRRYEKGEREEIADALMRREKLGPTYVGDGVAIPHAPVDVMLKTAIVFGLSGQGIDWDTWDEKLVYHIWMIIIASRKIYESLKVIAKINRLSKPSDFRRRISSSNTSKDIAQIITKEWIIS